GIKVAGLSVKITNSICYGNLSYQLMAQNGDLFGWNLLGGFLLITKSIIGYPTIVADQGPEPPSDITWLDARNSADPLFCAPDSGDFHIAANSPAIVMGDTIGALGVGCQQPPPPIDSDIFVNPLGDDTNDGYSSDSPFRTIGKALSFRADSLRPHTIYLAAGRYAPSTNRELFPLGLRSYVSLVGTHRDSVILDAEQTSGVIALNEVKGVSLKNLTISGGWDDYGSGIYGHGSVFKADSIIVKDCRADSGGAMMYLYKSKGSFTRLVAYDNFTDLNGSIIELSGSDATFSNCTILYYGVPGTFVSRDSHVQFLNSVLWGDSETFDDRNWFIATGGSLLISHSVLGCRFNFGIPVTELYYLGSNPTDILPAFTNIYYLELTLTDSSGLIDAGTTLQVWEGDTLLYLADDTYCGLAPDIGAFEWQPDSGCIIPDTTVNDTIYIPGEYILHPAVPNPFNLTTTIRFEVPQPAHAVLAIYNIRGQEVVSLFDSFVDPDMYEIQWNGYEAAGNRAPSGIYIARLTTPGYSKSIKMVLLK
ncbi:MAG: DUF1565 domain-containing protein, partial [Candidatus Marinimicrobia bacterium]|nr:DUF1565 domain-containing protein [Candidatus Neomarinimicrobiota bacterium]